MKILSVFTALFVHGLIASPLNTAQESPSKVFTGAAATPTSAAYNWSEGWHASFPIHQSCNSSLRAQLAPALEDAVQLAQHARNHLLRFGHKSDLVKKYFGNGSLAEPIGWYDRVVAADKGAMSFRCDDPDKNCATQPGWGGHWRGKNATEETVICPLSFQIRRPLSSVCNLGYTVAGSPLNTIWAVDLMHRMFHVPTISENVVDHYAEDYSSVVALASKEPAKSAKDSNTLQYFAIDTWAYDIAAPGVGCTGTAAKKV